MNDGHSQEEQPKIGGVSLQQSVESATTARSTPKARTADWGGKAVLLVDSSTQSRDSRAKIMRTLGAVVDCASSAGAALAQFGSGSYNLVLIDLKHDFVGAEQLALDIRNKNPRQLVAFLVGSPLFVSKSLRRSGASNKPTPPPASARPEPRVSTAAEVFDFGQKIRDAEAKVVA